jgi:ATP-dependent DNA ligase
MNKKLPQLFARGNAGQVLEWEIEVEGGRYRTITGAQGCQHVTSSWTELSEGKNLGRSNATTTEEQALAEATSRWEKKQKSGGYWLDIKDIDKSKFVEPMLANHYKDRVGKVKFPVMVDRKYNGMRQVVNRTGQKTRKGESIISAPHIWLRVNHLFDQFPDLVLDGELYNHELRYKLNELISLVRKTKLKSITPEDFQKSEEIVDYYVYDGYGFTVDGVEITQETPCYERRLALQTLLKGIRDVVVAEFRIAKDHNEVMDIFRGDIIDGYEGSIVRVKDAPYENKRSYGLLKVKPEDDDEGIAKKVIEGTGNWSGAAKTVTVEWRGYTFDASLKGTYDELVDLLNHPEKLENKTITFLHIGYTGKALPNAPLGLPFSPRVDINNCFKGDRK